MPRFEAERTQDLGEVLRWYELQLLLLKEEDRRLPHLLSDDLIPERYRDQSIEELRQQFASARKHLRYAAMLHLLTTTEALLRLGFEDLSRRKTKPAIFRRFRQIERDRREKIRLEEDILDTFGSSSVFCHYAIGLPMGGTGIQRSAGPYTSHRTFSMSHPKCWIRCATRDDGASEISPPPAPAGRHSDATL